MFLKDFDIQNKTIIMNEFESQATQKSTSM